MQVDHVKNSWQSIECGVEGYALSSMSFARYLQDLACKGDFAALREMLNSCNETSMQRITLAIKVRDPE